MANRTPRIYVLDIIEEIDCVNCLIEGRDLASYEANKVVRRAIERCIEIISEASRRIPDEIKARYPRIPWKQVSGIGNILRHDYGLVQNQIIWNIGIAALPELRRAMTDILAQLPEDPEDPEE